jgi:hypothetical protein
MVCLGFESIHMFDYATLQMVSDYHLLVSEQSSNSDSLRRFKYLNSAMVPYK